MNESHIYENILPAHKIQPMGPSNSIPSSLNSAGGGLSFNTHNSLHYSFETNSSTFNQKVYTSVRDYPSYQITEDKMEKIRPVMIQEIRRRKLAKLKSWEILSNRYLHVKHKWNYYVSELEAVREKGKGSRGTPRQ